MARVHQKIIPFFPELEEIAADLDDAQFGALIRAAFAYRLREEEYTGADPLVRFSFRVVKSQLDRYADQSEKRRASAMKRIVRDSLPPEEPEAYAEIPAAEAPCTQSLSPDAEGSVQQGDAKCSKNGQGAPPVHSNPNQSNPNHSKPIQSFSPPALGCPAGDSPPGTGSSGRGKKEIIKFYGRYGNVLLTDGELAQLKADFPGDWEHRIENLSEYLMSTGKHYRSHLATIRSWALREQGKKNQPGKGLDIDPGLQDLDPYF